jgi:hypothetical protein
VPRKSYPFVRELIGHRVHSFCESTKTDSPLSIKIGPTEL